MLNVARQPSFCVERRPLSAGDVQHRNLDNPNAAKSLPSSGRREEGEGGRGGRGHKGQLTTWSPNAAGECFGQQFCHWANAFLWPNTTCGDGGRSSFSTFACEHWHCGKQLWNRVPSTALISCLTPEASWSWTLSYAVLAEETRGTMMVASSQVANFRR